MLGEVQYGGRVTDDFDKRLLNTFCRVWFHENMFSESFKFYQGYTIPRCNILADFKAHIEELPMVDSPEVSKRTHNLKVSKLPYISGHTNAFFVKDSPEYKRQKQAEAMDLFLQTPFPNQLYLAFPA